MNTAAVQYRISDSIVLESGKSAIHRYKLFSTMFGKKIYGLSSGFAALDGIPALTSDSEVQHLTEEQSRALKVALLSSARIVDEGFLID